MTEPSPGPDDIPKPWDGKPPPRYRSEWDVTVDPVYVEYAEPDPEPGPPRGPDRRMMAGIAAVIIVVVAAGVALWWLGQPSGGANAALRRAATSSAAPTAIRQRPGNTPPAGGRTTPDSAAAYDVGQCFDEQFGSAAGNVELNPVPCAGGDAVFVINAVEPTSTACDSGPGSADYHDHGYEVPDDTAGVTYCASLVVPVNSCFTLAPNTPIAVAACGSSPDVVQVLSIESAPTAGTACTDKTNPDVWFYQSPASGQYACVSRAAGGGSSATTPTTPTSAG